MPDEIIFQKTVLQHITILIFRIFWVVRWVWVKVQVYGMYIIEVRLQLREMPEIFTNICREIEYCLDLLRAAYGVHIEL
ncbi:hypothetical protein J6590_013445 [Homalodisca vitripennis]|nr:hypothetical protein J6590_013445 [Homalodisca vitripennis]